MLSLEIKISTFFKSVWSTVEHDRFALEVDRFDFKGVELILNSVHEEAKCVQLDMNMVCMYAWAETWSTRESHLRALNGVDMHT